MKVQNHILHSANLSSCPTIKFRSAYTIKVIYKEAKPNFMMKIINLTSYF